MAFAAVCGASQDFTGQGQKEMAAMALGESKSPRKGKCYSKGDVPSHREEKNPLSLDMWEALMRKQKSKIWKNGRKRFGMS